MEARDATALSRGMQGFTVRNARALNRLMDRAGSVFADRYHERVLRTPTQVRNAIHYTLSNAKKHGVGARRRGWVDALSTAPWFEGWKGAVRYDADQLPGADPPTEAPRMWLLKCGWERGGGLLDPDRRPGPAR